MNMDLLTPRNILIIVLIGWAWLHFGKRFIEKNVTETEGKEE